MSNQLVKKNPAEGYQNIFPKTWIDAIKDKESGVSLQEILQGFNMYFLSYNGNRALTRCKVPSILRKEGLWITYVLYDHTVVTEWYNSDQIDDNSWSMDSNWRVASNFLVGDVSVSADGYWVINGEKTEAKAQGEQGVTPLLRVGANNKLQVSYNAGKAWKDISDYIVPRFRYTRGTTNNTAGIIQISMDLGKTWTNLSNEITNNLRISRYIGINESLPTSGVAEGTIYMKGPYYNESDTSNANPIYRMWVYAWKGNTLAWQDNGEFTSISAGVVQERGTSTTKVMSQDAITRELTELESEISQLGQQVISDDKVLFDDNHKGHWYGVIGNAPFIMANTETNYRYLQFYVDGENLRVGDTITFIGRSLGADYPGIITIDIDGRALHNLSTVSYSTYSYTVQEGDVWIYISTAYAVLGNTTYVSINNAARVVASTNSKLIKERYVAKSDVIDNLISSDIDYPLSANQGKALNEKIETISFILDNKFKNNDLSKESSTNGLAEGFVSMGTNTVYSLSEGVQSVTRGADASGDVLRIPFVNSPNSKIYLGFYVKAPGTLYINWFGSQKTIFSENNIDASNYQFSSAIWDGTNSSISAIFTHGSTDTYMYKRIVILNLTEIFGAGNEPNKDIIDYLVAGQYEGAVVEESISIRDVWSYICKIRRYIGVDSKTTTITRDTDGTIVSVVDTYEDGTSYTTTIIRDDYGNVIDIKAFTPFGNITETPVYSDGYLTNILTKVKL